MVNGKETRMDQHVRGSGIQAKDRRSRWKCKPPLISNPSPLEGESEDNHKGLSLQKRGIVGLRRGRPLCRPLPKESVLSVLRLRCCYALRLGSGQAQNERRRVAEGLTRPTISRGSDRCLNAGASVLRRVRPFQ